MEMAKTVIMVIFLSSRRDNSGATLTPTSEAGAPPITRISTASCGDSPQKCRLKKTPRVAFMPPTTPEIRPDSMTTSSERLVSTVPISRAASLNDCFRSGAGRR